MMSISLHSPILRENRKGVVALETLRTMHGIIFSLFDDFLGFSRSVFGGKRGRAGEMTKPE
jgi:hypothetical protein